MVVLGIELDTPSSHVCHRVRPKMVTGRLVMYWRRVVCVAYVSDVHVCAYIPLPGVYCLDVVMFFASRIEARSGYRVKKGGGDDTACRLLSL